MRINTQDLTLKKNYIQKYRFLIKEYELVKQKKHPRYKFAQEFYQAHDTDRRSFLKHYNRFKQSGNERDLLPQKRGPKWKTRLANICKRREQTHALGNAHERDTLAFCKKHNKKYGAEGQALGRLWIY